MVHSCRISIGWDRGQGDLLSRRVRSVLKVVEICMDPTEPFDTKKGVKSCCRGQRLARRLTTGLTVPNCGAAKGL